MLENIEGLVTSRGAPGCAATSLGAFQIALQVSGKDDIIIVNAAGACGNRNYYLSFHDF